MYYDLRNCFLEATARLPLPVKGKVLACIQRFQANPRSPGLHLEKLSGGSEGLSSLRVDDQYRVILHQSPELVTLLVVAPHNDAYRFAERVPNSDGAGTPGAQGRQDDNGLHARFESWWAGVHSPLDRPEGPEEGCQMEGSSQETGSRSREWPGGGFVVS